MNYEGPGLLCRTGWITLPALLEMAAMAEIPSRCGGIRIGDWDLDTQTGELHKPGTRRRLQEQPLQILQVLLERPGEMVTREELRKRIWPADTFVDFDHGLYSAVKRLRDTLGDPKENPVYIQTLARRGYRLIAPVMPMRGPSIAEPSPALEVVPKTVRRVPFRFTSPTMAILAAATLLLVALIAFNVRGLRDRLFATRPSRPITSLAVLPLENLSADPAQEYFAEGMTDELITDLAQLGDLRVVSRTSAMHYKATQKTLPQIARELGVDAVVEGTVARAGDRVRIRVQLIRTEDDRHLWAQAYDRDLRDILLLQSDAARDIAAQISINLNPSRGSRRLSQARPLKPEAYEAYLKGRYFWTKRTRESNEKAVAYFQQAIRQDPDFAPAYAGLADAYVDRALAGDRRKTEVDEARAAANKALEIDPSLAEPHVSIAGVLEIYDWNWTEADKEYRRALELNPNYATGHQIYAVYLVAVGRFDQAIAEARLAQHLDPVSPFAYTTGCLVSYFAAQYDPAIEQCRKALEIDPNFANAHRNLVNIYVHKKMYDQAVDEFDRSATLIGIKPEAVSELRQAYRVSGIKGFWHKQLELDSRGVYVGFGLDTTFGRAEVCALLGENSAALNYLEAAYKERDAWLEFLNVDPQLHDLRSEPRFQDLVYRVGLQP
jgi:TolB-like protein/DNA-binding winged helix-turn-helix (wHTH) protein/Tfp pilus assembly protein PilF